MGCYSCYEYYAGLKNKNKSAWYNIIPPMREKGGGIFGQKIGIRIRKTEGKLSGKLLTCVCAYKWQIIVWQGRWSIVWLLMPLKRVGTLQTFVNPSAVVAAFVLVKHCV